jgi:hypothetical protein
MTHLLFHHKRELDERQKSNLFVFGNARWALLRGTAAGTGDKKPAERGAA